MAVYYSYLWRTTWPTMSGLFFLWFFILGRLIWKIVKTCRHERDAWGFFLLGWKVFLWGGVLAIYTVMLLPDLRDWFYQPAFFQGEIQEKNDIQNRYTITVRNSSRLNTLSLDDLTYKGLQAGDKVKVMFLSQKLELVQCEILAPDNR